MSFRQESRKEKDRTKMSVRDMRLYMTISGQKKAEEQESILEEIEGSRRKTPTKRSSAIKKSTGKVDIHQIEENERDVRIKKRLKKMKKKKVSSNNYWKTYGPIRNVFPRESWSEYSPHIGKIHHYEGFETSDAPPLFRLYVGQEHRDRFVRCHVCEKPMNSTEDFFQTETGICMHRECMK